MLCLGDAHIMRLCLGTIARLFCARRSLVLENLPWASRRRKELLELLDQLDPKIAELTAAVEQKAKQLPEVQRLMTHPGVGPITGLVYVLVIGTPDRFPCGKKIGSYTGRKLPTF
jgi:transposase